jgi:hypothetical protein
VTHDIFTKLFSKNIFLDKSLKLGFIDNIDKDADKLKEDD